MLFTALIRQLCTKTISMASSTAACDPGGHGGVGIRGIGSWDGVVTMAAAYVGGTGS
jgi:hypothetical protein